MAVLGAASAAAALLHEHRLRMVLRADGRGLTAVESLPRRASQAHRVLVGRTTQQALALLPSLFPLSAMAHRSACAAALATLQRRACAAGDEAMTRALLLERLREHLLPLHREWPLCMAVAPSQQILQAIDQGTRGTNIARAEPGRHDTLRELVETNSLGMPAGRFLQIDSAAALHDWARDHQHLAPARFFHWLWAQPLALRRVELPPALPRIEAGQLAPRLLGDAGEAFEAAPQWESLCRETGPWAQQWPHPLLRDLARPGGEAAALLLGRFAAWLLELAQAFLDWVEASDAPDAVQAADGCALVRTARGTLAHAVAVDTGGRITRCAILAPAQWNFHPLGTASQMLGAIAWTTPRQVAQTASLVACAIDPFVRCDFALPEVAAAR